ncbi:MAG TPA: hypothetical protein VMM58_05890, partial [Bacteroidota bacterium]|nr:hypothetical protein [Bacteroidota bacterium]
MKNKISTILLLFTFISPSQAQNYSPFLKVDTLTAGEFDDSRPAMQRSFSPSEGSQWLVFERRSDSASMIAAKICSRNQGKWDTAVVIISSRPTGENQILPDIATNSYINNVDRSGPRTVAAWQRLENGVWNIYFSSTQGDSSAWSAPAPVLLDTISSTHVHVFAFNDSLFMLAWKKKNAVLFSFLSFPSPTGSAFFTAADTLAKSNDDSLEWDVTWLYSYGGVVYTLQDSTGQKVFVSRQMNSYPTFTLSQPETLSVRGNISDPRFPVPFFGIVGSLTYEVLVNGLHQVHVWDGYSDTNLSKDTTADYRNALGFYSPVTTVGGGILNKGNYYPFTILVMEKNRGGDSSLLFVQNAYWGDTVHTAGSNQHATISPMLCSVPQYASAAVPIVWESNRTGRSHLYTRLVLVPLGDVKENRTIAENFQLQQNFPNPFNPSTTIRFQLFSAGKVTVRIIDLLGRTVETLVDKTMTAGNYEARWDAKR